MKNQNHFNQPKKSLVIILLIALTLITLNCNLNQEGTLSVEAGLVYKAGDVKPVARADFYLLNDDLETIIKNAGIEEKDMGGLNQKLSFVQKLSFWKKFPALYPNQLAKAVDVIKQHTVYTITTDFSGKGEFTQIKSGKYWLAGIGGANQIVVWNLPIDIKAGKQSISLDNNNAATIQ